MRVRPQGRPSARLPAATAPPDRGRVHGADALAAADRHPADDPGHDGVHRARGLDLRGLDPVRRAAARRGPPRRPAPPDAGPTGGFYLVLQRRYLGRTGEVADRDVRVILTVRPTAFKAR